MLQATWMVWNGILFQVHLQLKFTYSKYSTPNVSVAVLGLGRERQENMELKVILDMLQPQHKILSKIEKKKNHGFPVPCTKMPPNDKNE